jgi:hypothetical protein
MPAGLHNVDLKENYSFVDSVPQTPLFVFNCVQNQCDISKLEFNIHELRSMLPSVKQLGGGGLTGFFFRL